MNKMDNKERDKLDESVKDMIICDYKKMLSDSTYNSLLFYIGYIKMLKITDEMNKSIINIKTTNSLTK